MSWRIQMGLHPDTTNVRTLQEYADTFSDLEKYCRLKAYVETADLDTERAKAFEAELEVIADRMPRGVRWW